MNRIARIRPVDEVFRAESNRGLEAGTARDYDWLGGKLAARGLDVEAVADRLAGFAVALPS